MSRILPPEKAVELMGVVRVEPQERHQVVQVMDDQPWLRAYKGSRRARGSVPVLGFRRCTVVRYRLLR